MPITPSLMLAAFFLAESRTDGDERHGSSGILDVERSIE